MKLVVVVMGAWTAISLPVAWLVGRVLRRLDAGPSASASVSPGPVVMRVSWPDERAPARPSLVGGSPTR